MKDAIQGHELFTLDVRGAMVRGTCHLPHDGGPGTQLRNPNRTGILLISGLLAPRSGIGDSLIYWADSFASCGYTCFRIDLPGSCDSGGDAPAEFMSFINGGGYEAVTVEIMRQITAQYNLSGLVLMGHCTGTVTAIFAASAGEDCPGLVLLEPYFHLPPPLPTKAREALSDWAASNRLGGILSNLFDGLKYLRLRLRLSLRSSELPGNANLPLVKRWERMASAGVPMLVLKAPGLKTAGAKPRLGEFDYLGHVVGPAARNGRVEVMVIEGAAHSFAGRTGRLAVRDNVQSWLGKHFPHASAPIPSVHLQRPELQKGNLVRISPF